MEDVVGTKTHRARMLRAAATGGAVVLADTGTAEPEPQVCAQLRLLGEP